MQSVGMNIPRYLGVFISSSLRNHGFYAETNNSTITPSFNFVKILIGQLNVQIWQ